MNRKQLFILLKKYHSEELDLVQKKNRDYASDKDPFANFQMFGELGFLVRLSDKLMRLKQVFERGEISVTDESVKDTLMDLSNYANLLMAYRESKLKK